MEQKNIAHTGRNGIGNKATVKQGKPTVFPDENLKNISLSSNEASTSLQIPVGLERLKVPVSRVAGLNPKIQAVVTLETIFGQLQRRDEKALALTSSIRHEAQTDPVRYKESKEKLPGFIVGDFEKRNDQGFRHYVPLLVFDVDCLKDEAETAQQLERLKDLLFVFAAWFSPSGRGLRILVWCNATPHTHKAVYGLCSETLAQFLQIPIGGKGTAHIDPSTTNISRHWFYCPLPNGQFYLNLESKVFAPANQATHTPTIIAKENKTKDHAKAHAEPLTDREKIDLCRSMADSRHKSTGNRNQYLFLFAGLMHEHGFAEPAILNECLQFVQPDFTEAEVRKTVKSAVERTNPNKYTDEQMRHYKSKLDSQPAPAKYQGDHKAAEKNKATAASSTSKFVRIRQHIESRYDFRLDIVANEIECKPKNATKWQPVNENNLLCELMERGESGVENPLLALLGSDFVRQFDPFEAYFENLPIWNDTKPDYIKELANFVKTKDDTWFSYMFRKMLVRTIACALRKIPFNKHCFTLVGKQNDGKTTFLRFLCPPALSGYLKENLDIQNKDGRFSLCQNLFINLDELATFSRQDINQIKSFFTIDQVKERVPYDRRPKVFARRASFLASTNATEFLTDETGNVRWLVFEVDGIKHDNGGPNGYAAKVNINNVWGQAYALFKSGYDFKLSKEEIETSEGNNLSFQKETIEQFLIQERYSPATKQEYKDKCPGICFKISGDILKEIQNEIKTPISLKGIGQALKYLQYEQGQEFFKEYNQQRKGYYMKDLFFGHTK